MRHALGCAALCVAMSNQVAAQPANPAISAIGDTRLRWVESADQPVLEFEELEIGLVGPLNPYASAEVFVAAHADGGFEVEEAALSLERYLPAGLGLKVGRFLLDFGQLAPLHPHAYPFVNRPLMHAEFFGDDGPVDTGVRLDWLAPLEPVTCRITAGVLRGAVFQGGHAHGEGEEQEEVGPELGLSARLELYAEPSSEWSWLAGASVLRGTHDPHEEARATWVDVDLKSHFDFAATRSLVVNAEAAWGRLDPAEDIAAQEPRGWFASADLRVGRRWNVGGFAESATERLDSDIQTQRLGGFLGLALMEESTVFRLLGAVVDPEVGELEAVVELQALFGLGPHRPHRF